MRARKSAAAGCSGQPFTVVYFAVEAVMFQKLARAVIVCASVLLVISRIMLSVHPSDARCGPIRATHAADSACIVSQLMARRA